MITPPPTHTCTYIWLPPFLHSDRLHNPAECGGCWVWCQVLGCSRGEGGTFSGRTHTAQSHPPSCQGYGSQYDLLASHLQTRRMQRPLLRSRLVTRAHFGHFEHRVLHRHASPTQPAPNAVQFCPHAPKHKHKMGAAAVATYEYSSPGVIANSYSLLLSLLRTPPSTTLLGGV
jgi:hypothetical protein